MRLSFRYVPENFDVWTDEAIIGLVGQECDISFFGQGVEGRCLVTNALRYTDEMLGGGIWVEVKVVNNG